MNQWVRNEDGKIFDNEEDAYLDSLETLDSAYLFDIICAEDLIPHDKLLHWVMGLDEFWEHFQDEIADARGIMFIDNYHAVDEDEE